MFNKKEIIKQVDYLTKSDEHNLWLYDKMFEKVKEIEKDIDLIFDYLGVHKETINDTFLVEGECICDECLDELDRIENIKNEEKWEDTKPKKKK